MTRRELLKAFSAAMVAAGFQGRRLRNFVWMRPSLGRPQADWARDFAMMRDAGIHGIIPEIYNGRQALFQSRRLPIRAPWLESIIPLAKSAGLEVHAWMWSMPCLLDDVL